MGLFSKKEPVWIQETHLLKADIYICSVCGHKEKSALKVCPSCGSKMSGKKYDPTWVDEAEMIDIFLGGK